MLAVLEEEAGRSFGRDSQRAVRGRKKRAEISPSEHRWGLRRTDDATPFVAVANLHNIMGGSWAPDEILMGTFADGPWQFG